MNKKEFKRKVSEDEELKSFLADRDRSEGTKNQYEFWILGYCYFHNKTPTELLDEAIKEEQNPQLHASRRKIKKRILQYKEYLKNRRNISPKVLQNHITIIKAFYKFSEIEFPNIDNGAKVKRRLETDEDLPSRETIREALKYASKKYRAIITLQASSGMRKAEVRNLTYKDFLFAIQDYVKINDRHKFDIKWIKEQLNDREDIIPAWKPFSSKTQTEYITFCTPECLKYIFIYLDHRQNSKNPIKSEDDYLFAGIPRKNNPNGQISDQTYMKYFQRLNKELNLGKNKNQAKHGFFTSHQLRRFFATTLDGVTRREKADEMLGHVKGNIEGAYFKTKKDDLFKHYKNAVDEFTFDKPEIIDRTNEKIQELEAKIKAKDVEMKAQKEENEMLKAKLEELDGRLGSIEERGSEVRNVNIDTFGVISDANMKLAETIVPKDAENRAELIQEHYMKLMKETWEKFPLV